MSNNSKALNDQMISRRSFLKGTAGAALLVVTAGSVGAALTACTSKPTADFEVTSSTDFNHAHKVMILGADVDKPPESKTITSDGPTHQHAITLSKANFQSLKKGETVTLTSTSTGSSPHTHTFALKVPAA
jgi:hypothetical protein